MARNDADVPPPLDGLGITTTREAGRRASLAMLVHGQSGAGKTWLAQTTGDHAATLVIAAEPGLLTLRNVDIPAIHAPTVDVLKRVFLQLRAGGHPYRWIIVDSISEVAEASLAHHKRECRDPRKAYGEMGDQVVSLIKAYLSLPCHVVMTCKQERVQDDSGRLIYAASIPGQKVSQSLPYLFDEVLALRVERSVDAEGNPAVTRYLQTQPDGAYDAKDRSGALALYEPPDLGAIAHKIMGETQ